MNLLGMGAVGGGAAAGAWLRFLLGLALNPLFAPVPLGTLAANLLGGYLIGLTLPFFGRYTSLPPEVRLAFTTGFLGGLTTFSSYSAEVVSRLTRHDFGSGLLILLTHLAGSLLMTYLGIFTMKGILSGKRS